MCGSRISSAPLTRCAASGARGCDQNEFQKFNSFVKSRQSGFNFSIGSIFHARR
jgi:hypothetical protein